MAIKAVLFDLDGTLLPMDQEIFIKAYFGGIAAKLAPHGYDPKALVGAIWQGTEDMIKNDGSCTNEDAFWKRFCAIMGDGARADEPIFEDFYKNEFQGVKAVCGYAEESKKIVDSLKARGIRVALATNPIFPRIATESRVRWAGMSPEDFELITTYENIGYCKPNPKYYTEILARLGLCAEECVMVGNDTGDDMVAAKLGMKVFLLTNDLINKSETDISVYPSGGFAELAEFLGRL